MIKFILKIAVILTIGILVYNYFFGTADEKQNSKEVYSKAKDLTVSVVDLLKNEKDKFEKGKYDQALDQIDNAISAIKEKGKLLSANDQLKLRTIEQDKEALQREIIATDQLSKQEADKKAKELDKKVIQILHATESLVKE